MTRALKTWCAACAAITLWGAIRAAEPVSIDAKASGVIVATRPEGMRRVGSESRLEAAIEAKDAVALRQSIEQRVDLNALTSAGATPLIAAIDCGFDEAVRRLLAAGANANKPDRAGASALFHAIERDRADYVLRLLEAGEDLQHGRTADETALVGAMQLWHPAIIAVLLQAGADPSTEWRGFRLIHLAAVHGESELIRALLAKGEDLNCAARVSGATPLIAAAQSGSVSAVRVILEFHPEVNARNALGRSALMYAAERGRLAVCEALLAAGAQVNAADNHGDTAYLVAGQRGHVTVLEYLQRSGANVVPLHLPKRPRRGDARSDRLGFALAMAALEFSYYGGSYAQWPDTSRPATAVLAELRGVHRIRDAADLRGKLDQLLAQAHRSSESDVARLSDEAFAQRLEAVLDNPVKVLALKQARQRTKEQAADDVAWRLCHHNYLAAAGVTAGLLPADEAKERILSAAQALEAAYSSWEVVAPELSAGLRRVETDGARIDLLTTLLANREDPESPWTQHPFPKRRSAAKESARPAAH